MGCGSAWLESAAVPDFSELSIRGRIATSSDSDWDEARQPWNLAADQRPEAVALVESADDVSKVIRFARENGLKVAGQGTGHGAVALGPLDGVILVKTERMRDVAIEGEKARAEAGALAEDVAEAASAQGMSSMPGTSPNVGVAGYTLGGGLSWFGRKHGWACNRVSALEVVTADGEPRTVDAASDPDLFWALRGGGGVDTRSSPPRIARRDRGRSGPPCGARHRPSPPRGRSPGCRPGRLAADPARPSASV